MSASNYVAMERSSSVSPYEENHGSSSRGSERFACDEQQLLDVLAASANDATTCGQERSLPTTTAAAGSASEVAEPTLSPTLASKKGRIQEYLTSPDVVELGACASWYLVSYVVPTFLVGSHERPIPYQYLDGTNEYVRNLVNNEEEENGSTVSVAMLVLLGVLLPLGLQLAVAWRCGARGDAHATMCAHLVAHGTTRLATEAAKRYVGYLRPIFYAACDPSEDYQACSSSDASDARKSFPSGHSSTSFCGLALLTLYLHCRLGMGSVRSQPRQAAAARNDSLADDEITMSGSSRTGCQQPRRPRPIVYYRFVSFVSMVGPMGLAYFVACSRVVDNEHFPADVVGGAALGLGVAVYVNGLWWWW